MKTENEEKRKKETKWKEKKEKIKSISPSDLYEFNWIVERNEINWTRALNWMLGKWYVVRAYLNESQLRARRMTSERAPNTLKPNDDVFVYDYVMSINGLCRAI